MKSNYQVTIFQSRSIHKYNCTSDGKIQSDWSRLDR